MFGGNYSLFNGHAFQPVDLVRLHLDSFSFVQDANSVRVDVVGEWEIYGPVPEPAVAWMLLAGLAVLLFRLRTFSPMRHHSTL